MVAWPPTLPDFAVHHISGSFGEGRNVTPSDSGRVQARVISGRPPDPLNVSQDYTGAQMAELRTFYFDALEGGVLPFTHTNLFTSTTATYQFKPDSPPPRFDHIVSGKDAHPREEWFWRVQFELLQLPS